MCNVVESELDSAVFRTRGRNVYRAWLSLCCDVSVPFCFKYFVLNICVTKLLVL